MAREPSRSSRRTGEGSGSPSVCCGALGLAHRGVPVLQEVDLMVEADQVLALLGPSGSGKSTLLQAIAGFVPPAAGEIWLAGRQVATPRRIVPPEHRDIGMVFQSHALWPHLTALDTVAYPVRRAGFGRRAARDRARELLERLDIAQLADRRPIHLSGGEQQRVGLARALAREASVYLFDEPTAHLDTHLRATFTEELLQRRRQTGAAAIYATHDASEALALADQVAVLGNGRVVQVGTPAQLYAEPVSLWVARLTGPASVLRGSVCRDDGGRLGLHIGGTRVQPAGIESAEDVSSARLLVRPDWATLDGPLTGRLTDVRFRGPHTDYLITTPAGELLVRSPGPPQYLVGEQVHWALARAHLLAGES